MNTITNSYNITLPLMQYPEIIYPLSHVSIPIEST
jgi:hypothetical protein